MKINSITNNISESWFSKIYQLGNEFGDDDDTDTGSEYKKADYRKKRQQSREQLWKELSKLYDISDSTTPSQTRRWTDDDVVKLTGHFQDRLNQRHPNPATAIVNLVRILNKHRDTITSLPDNTSFIIRDENRYNTVFIKDRDRRKTEYVAITVFPSAGPKIFDRSRYVFTEADDNITLGNLVKMSVGMPDADFWIRRSGQLKSLGEPSRQFDPDKIGIKVTATNIIDPNYLYYVFMHLQNQGVFAQMATGSTGLQHIKISSLAKIPFALSESLNEEDDEPIRIRLRGNEDTAKRWIQKVYDQYPVNQLNPRQHIMPFGDDEYVIFELTPSFNRRGAVEVKWISAHPQRKGLGSKALKTLQDLAKNHNVMLTLYPWEKGDISQRDLKRFYKKQGFKGEGGGSDYMRWDPLSEDDAVTFAGKDPRSFTSPKGGKAAMVLVTAQGSRYLVTDDGMVLRHKSAHANTGGEDAGLKSWSDKIEYFDPSEKVGGTTFPLAVSAAVSKGLPVALSTVQDGRRALVILDNGKWRVAKISDVFKHVAADDAKILSKYSTTPKLNWNPMDYDISGNGVINRVHPGSPVTHGAAIKHTVAEGDYDDMDYDDDTTPNIEGAKSLIKLVKQHSDSYNELPITGVLSQLEYEFHLDSAAIDEVLQPIKNDIIIYLNTMMSSSYEIYGAVRRLDKLYRSGVAWEEFYRILENHKHAIIKHMLEQYKRGNQGTAKEMIIILNRMGIAWTELKAILRSIDADYRISETDDYYTIRNHIKDKVLKSFKLGPWNGFKSLDFFNMKADEVPGAVEALENYKTDFVKRILSLMKTGDYGDVGTARNLAYQMQKVGMQWPELDVVINSANKAFDDYDKSLGLN